MGKYKIGDIVYVSATSSSTGWVKCKIIKLSNGYYIVRKLDSKTVFGASEHRIFTEEEYKKLQEDKNPIINFKPPPLH